MSPDRHQEGLPREEARSFSISHYKINACRGYPDSALNLPKMIDVFVYFWIILVVSHVQCWRTHSMSRVFRHHFSNENRRKLNTVSPWFNRPTDQLWVASLPHCPACLNFTWIVKIHVTTLTTTETGDIYDASRLASDNFLLLNAYFSHYWHHF